MKKKIRNRWFVVLGAVFIQVCLGAIYSWSLFNQPLIDKFGWRQDQVVMTYSIAIFMFAISTLVSGRLQDKIGPRIVASIGGIMYGLGMILASLTTSLMGLYLAYGVLAGAGVGFAYVCPLAACIKWFPEKKGLIAGIAVSAFGAGSLIFKSVIENLLGSVGVSATFMYLGIIYMIIVVLGAQLLRVPQEVDSKSALEPVENSLTIKQMVKTRSFYLLWITFMFGCMPGLLVIGLAKDIGINMVSLTPMVAANAVGLIALFNAGGRLAWGAISDKIGRIRVVVLMFLITAISLIIMSTVQMSLFSFFICLAGIAFSYGGFLAVYPTIVGEFFGIKTLGANYGIVFQAYGIAALIGPVIKGNTSNFSQTFMIAAAFAIVGGVLAMMIKPIKVKSQA